MGRWSALLLLIGCSLVNGQTERVFDVVGLLKFVDRPPDATPVEVLSFQLHPVDGGLDIEAHPNPEGKFILSGVRPGRYSLTFPMPGRIDSFTNNSIEIGPDGFELTAAHMGPLVLVVSTKSGDVLVNVQALPTEYSDVIALLAPADSRLTLRLSCYVMQLRGPQVSFMQIPPGKYRILVFDSQFGRDVAAYAPRDPAFLKGDGTFVDVPGSSRIEATATYLDSETIKRAILRAGGPFDPFRHL
jgi:hypothetical protein